MARLLRVQPIDQVPPVAIEQAGVFTAQQALEAGWSARQIRRRLAGGRWQYVAGRGLGVPSARGWSPHQLGIAAQLTVPSAITSHLTAAALQGFPVPADPRSHVVTGKVHRNLRNMVTHRVPVIASDVQAYGGQLMVTTPARTAVDCLALLDTDAQLRLWAWVSARGILTLRQLRQSVAGHAGRPGVTRLRSLLEVAGDGAVSVAERRFLGLLRSAGITGGRAGATIEDDAGIIAVADVLFERARLVIEIDGFEAHRSRDAFIRDRRRQNRLVAAGYTVLRFTWDDLTNRPEDVVTRVREALQRASARF